MSNKIGDLMRQTENYRDLPLLIFCLSFVCYPASADTGETGDKQSASFTLQGGIEHSEKLAPVEKQFRHGAKLDSSKLQDAAQANRWYRLPDWAAGTWTSVQSTKTYIHDLKNNLEQSTPITRSTKMEFTWGFQQDKEGHAWEYAKEPYSLSVDTADHRVIKRVLKREFLELDESKVTLKTITENIVVDKFNKVMRTVQSENIQTCQPGPNQCMTCSASYKLFDEQGKPVELGKETNVSRKIAPFKSIDEYEGKNMPLLFREYLSSQGKAELLN